MKNIHFVFIGLLTLIISCQATTKEESNSYKGIKAIVMAESNYIQTGSYFNARIYFNREVTDKLELVFAEDFSENAEYTVEGEEIVIKKLCNNIGLNTLKATISIKNQDGVIKTIQVEHVFFVTPYTFVLYNKETAFILNKGQENKLEVSVQGLPIDMITLSTNNGALKKEGASYTIVPGNEGECVISILKEGEGVSGMKMGIK